MILELRLIVLATILIIPCWGAPTFATPVIRLSEPETPPGLPAVSFAVPKYRLTALERETVAACLILEAASQGEFGMRGVMSVIRNRARGLPELLAPTVLRQKQFSAFNRITAGYEPIGRAIRRAQNDPMWDTALELVEEATGDAWHDPTHGATHYTRAVEYTRWTQRLARTVRNGTHSFCR